jgi:hypothetical protein
LSSLLRIDARREQFPGSWIDGTKTPSNMRACFLVAVLFIGTVTPVFASPTVVSASLTVGVDDIADFWMNGVHLANVPYTPREKGQALVELKDLCVFKRTNVLAMRVRDTGPTEAGIAYLLRLVLSDGRWLVLSSSEEKMHRCHFVADAAAPEPPGWFREAFDDRRWIRAFNLGATFPNMGGVSDETAKRSARYMSASGESSKIQKTGERHLFRRYFLLDVTVREECFTPSPTVENPATPTPSPLATSTPTTRERRTMTFTRTSTPVPTRTSTRTPVASPTPRPARTAIRRAVAFTATPSLAVKRAVVAPRRTSTATVFAPTKEIPPYHPATVTQTPKRPQPLTTVATKRADSAAGMPSTERIVFEQPPLVFFVSFKDPGEYRLEVFDAQGRWVCTLFDEKVAAPREQWVEWNGKNSMGTPVGAGEYTVVYVREGRPVRKITAVLRHE